MTYSPLPACHAHGAPTASVGAYRTSICCVTIATTVATPPGGMTSVIGTLGVAETADDAASHCDPVSGSDALDMVVGSTPERVHHSVTAAITVPGGGV